MLADLAFQISAEVTCTGLKLHNFGVFREALNNPINAQATQGAPQA